MDKTLLLLPGPVTLAQPVLQAMARPMINHRGAAFGALLGRVEAALQPAFGTRGDIVLLGGSGTIGLEAAVANTLERGDLVLSASIGVFGRRFADIARAYGCTVEEFATPLGARIDAGALRERLTADRERSIAAVLLTHNETSTGVQNDMAALAPVLREHGALSLVDSVSGMGASAFAMDAWGYDVVVSASQKAFAAPPGVAMVAASARAWQRIESVTTPRFYFDLRRARAFKGNGQTPWTPPLPVLFALDAALERYAAVGLEATFARHDRYARAVRAAFEALGFTLFSRPDAHSVTVVAAGPPPGIEAAALLTRLRERYGVVLSGGQGELAGKIVRFGTMGDITESDVLGAIGAIELALADLGARPSVGVGAAAALSEMVRVEVGT